MTSIEEEVDVIFPAAFIDTLQWVQNLRITYPEEEIFIGDNDITDAFCTIQYHPALVAMHSFIIYGIPFMYTCLNLGNCTSPANFEVIAMARSQLAIFLW